MGPFEEIRDLMRRAFFSPSDAQTLILDAGWCAGTPIVDGNKLLPAARDSWEHGYSTADDESQYARQDLLASLQQDADRDDFESLLRERDPGVWMLYARADSDRDPYVVLAAVATTDAGNGARSVTHAAVLWMHGPYAVRFVIDDEATLHPFARDAITAMCLRVIADRDN